jgi:hypothetical protein
MYGQINSRIHIASVSALAKELSFEQGRRTNARKKQLFFKEQS